MSKLLLELNAKQKATKISPVGLFSGYDGRVYKLDESAVATTKQKAIDIPLNVEHCFTQKGCEAVGWFKTDTLELKEDGVYAKLELTQEGEDLIKSKKYRYLSPEFSVDKERNVVTIDGVALVNSPNFALEINNKQNNDTKEEQHMKEELQALQEQNEQLKKENNTLKKSVDDLLNQLKEQELNAAIAANKILPSEKDTLKELNYNTLKSYLQARKPLGHTKEFNTNAQQRNNEHDQAYNIAANLGWEA